MEFNGFKDFNDLYSLAQSNEEGAREITMQENESENDNKKLPENPFEVLDELEVGDKIRGHFQTKLSKSTRKRLRRQRKKKLDMGIKPIKQIKKVSQQTVIANKKHEKKQLNILIKRLSKI